MLNELLLIEVLAVNESSTENAALIPPPTTNKLGAGHCYNPERNGIASGRSFACQPLFDQYSNYQRSPTMIPPMRTARTRPHSDPRRLNGLHQGSQRWWRVPTMVKGPPDVDGRLWYKVCHFSRPGAKLNAAASTALRPGGRQNGRVANEICHRYTGIAVFQP